MADRATVRRPSGEGGSGTFAPSLGAIGNSVKGQLVTTDLSHALGLDLFVSAPGN